MIDQDEILDRSDVMDKMAEIGDAIADLAEGLEAEADMGEKWGGEYLAALAVARQYMAVARGLFYATEIERRSPAEHEAHKEALATVAHWGDEGF